MNITIVCGSNGLGTHHDCFFDTRFWKPPVMALGPSGKCYVDCTGGGIPSNVREHNVCLSACIFGEGVQRLDDGILPPRPLPSDRPRGQQTGQK